MAKRRVFKFVVVVLGISFIVGVLGIIGVIVGGARLVRAFTGGGLGQGLLGAVSIILGVFLLMRPLISLVFLVYVMGFWAIAGGVAMIVGSFWLRRETRPQLAGPA
jgi:hypothetical protein